MEALGPDTEGPAPGTAVVINPSIFCGQCEACLRGQQSLCERFAVLGEHLPGTHADYCVVPVRNLHPKPEPLSFAEAAAYPLVFSTAWRMLMTRARLQPGEWILVWGAGSGVGSAAVTLASSLGARVIATASRDDVLAVARERGAHATINHRSDDVLAAVRELTGGRGVEVVYEHVGADTWATSIEALRRGGRLVITGATTGGNPPGAAAPHLLEAARRARLDDGERLRVSRGHAPLRRRGASARWSTPCVRSRTPAKPSDGSRPASRTASSCSRSPMPEVGADEVLLVPDGAVSGNPGPGGWAVVLVKGATPAASSPAASRTRPTTAWSCAP